MLTTYTQNDREKISDKNSSGGLDTELLILLYAYINLYLIGRKYRFGHIIYLVLDIEICADNSITTAVG